jgi:hypothetical protein
VVRFWIQTYRWKALDTLNACRIPYCAVKLVEIILDSQPNSTYFVSRGENRLVSELQVRLTRQKAASFTLRLRLSDLGAQTA